MKYSRLILIGIVALLLGGCGNTTHERLKVLPANKSFIGGQRSVVILPFADYSKGDSFETAYRRTMLISENVTDKLVSNDFTLPVQEDVFLYLAKNNIISAAAYDKGQTASIDYELQGAWSDLMKSQLQKYRKMNTNRTTQQSVLGSPGTHGLTPDEIKKIGRHFQADYVLRGRIIRYKGGQDPSWNPLTKGVIGFITDGTSKLAFGHADSDKYDNWGNMGAGAMYGGLIGDGANWPYNGSADQNIFGVSGGSMGNTIFWGAIGAGLGNMAHNTGKTPQAVVQIRIWVQDAHRGHLVWTNRVDVKVSPQTAFADYQYDTLFEAATEKAISTLMDNFIHTADI